MMHVDLSVSIPAREWDKVAYYIRHRYALDLPEAIVGGMCHEADTAGHDTWRNDSWDCWLRKRLDEIRAWPTPGQSTTRDGRTAILHFFFVALSETKEMLTRLNASEFPNSEPDRPARSKISTTPQLIAPIDGTAARVAPVREVA